MLFSGNVLSNSEVDNMLPNIVLARYVRLHAVTWEDSAAAIFRAKGCAFTQRGTCFDICF